MIQGGCRLTTAAHEKNKTRTIHQFIIGKLRFAQYWD